MSDAKQRRNRTIELLDKYGIKHNDFLPLIETEADIIVKDKSAILKQFLTTVCSIQVSCDIREGNDVENSKQFFLQMLMKYGLSLDDITSKEQTIWKGSPTEQDVFDIGWRYEAIFVLCWALGFVEQLKFPSEICDVMLMIDLIKNYQTFDELLEKVKLRSKVELLDEADYIYCLRWASVDAFINQLPQPANISYSVLIERHRAINWLILNDETDFDLVSLDT